MKIILDVPDVASEPTHELLALWRGTRRVYARRPKPRRPGDKGGVAEQVLIRSIVIETTEAEDALLPAEFDSIKRSRAFREQQD